MRGSSGGRKPTSGSINKAGVQLFAPKYCTNEFSSWLKPKRQTSSWMSARSLIQRSSGPSSLKLLHGADRAVDRHPGHHFRMHEVAALAANFPDAVVRLDPDFFEMADQRALQIPAASSFGKAFAARLVKGIEHFAIDVELKLLGGGVADAHGLGTFIAGELRQLEFGKAALAGDAVHDLHLLGASGDGAKQPIAPGFGFVGEAGFHERVKREGGIAQPAEAVIPVAYAADFFGQGGGGGGDDAAGLVMSERFQRDKRAKNGFAYRAFGLCTCSTIFPRRA